MDSTRHSNDRDVEHEQQCPPAALIAARLLELVAEFRDATNDTDARRLLLAVEATVMGERYAAMQDAVAADLDRSAERSETVGWQRRSIYHDSSCGNLFPL
jgi:hypothetical protein